MVKARPRTLESIIREQPGVVAELLMDYGYTPDSLEEALRELRGYHVH